MRLYCVRHGESVANTENIFSNRDPSIHPLTALGRQQAAGTAEQLAALGVSFDACYSSDLLRAVQTAQIIGERLGLPCEVRRELREHDAGDVQGRSDAAAWEEYEGLLRRWFRDGDHNAHLDGGESLVELRARFSGFLAWLEALHGPQAVILLVAHGALFLSSIMGLVDNVSDAFVREQQMPNGAIIVIEGQGDQWTCLEWNGIVLAA